MSASADALHTIAEIMAALQKKISELVARICTLGPEFDCAVIKRWMDWKSHSDRDYQYSLPKISLWPPPPRRLTDPEYYRLP
jgi:hypothetical protein